MKISVVGLGPGDVGYVLPIVQQTIANADVIIGYKYYFQFINSWVSPNTEQIAKDLSEEEERAKIAIQKAKENKHVVVIGSGDAGIYSMASLVYQVAAESNESIELETLPGISAFLAAGSKLGAPLGHDFCCISLSDLMTPWPIIERRIEAAAFGDFVTSLYNPKSKKRYWQLDRFKEIFLRHRNEKTPVAIAKQVGREDEQITITTLKELDPNDVDMFSLVMIGNSQTFRHKNFLVTPRGYLNRKAESGKEIQQESFKIISNKINHLKISISDKWALTRIIHSTGIFDFDQYYSSNLQPIEKWHKFLINGGNIVTDVTMVKSGITKEFTTRFNNKIHCFLNDEDVVEDAKKLNITRSQAGIRKAMKLFPNALYVIGNAPTALIDLADELQKPINQFSPEGIIGAPVGFVNVTESKIRLQTCKNTPWIIIKDQRGGSAIAASIVNASFTLNEAPVYFKEKNIVEEIEF